MAMIPECDHCGKVYKNGYQGFFSKIVSKGSRFSKKDFTVEIGIHPKYLCGKCFKMLVRACLKGVEDE